MDMYRTRFLAFLLSFLINISYTDAQNLAQNVSESCQIIQARFSNVTSHTLPPQQNRIGGRNMTRCCVEAFAEFLSNNCTNSDQVFVDSQIFQPNAQFPCGAGYIGNEAGAAIVNTTYPWIQGKCRGWQLSAASQKNEWAQLLAAFILPAVVYSFNIPRPRKLRLWEHLFPRDIGSYRVVAGLAGALGAAVCVIVDTAAWLMITLAFAGPLLLSGTLEAIVDQRVLSYLQEHIKHKKLPLALRARMLFTILCGNLHMYPAWSDTMDQARRLDKIDQPVVAAKLREQARQRERAQPSIQVSYVKGETSAPTVDTTPTQRSSRSPSAPPASDRLPVPIDQDSGSHLRETDVRDLAADGSEAHTLNIVNDTHGQSQQHSNNLHQTQTRNSIGSNVGTDNRPSIDVDNISSRDLENKHSKSIQKVIVRLRAMLACQYSYGTTIGGPVVFFLGSFIYTLLDVHQNLGDEDIAEALAFGVFFTIIPHIAVIAGLLLAGNNPYILEGIVSVRDFKYEVGQTLDSKQLQRQLTYDANCHDQQKAIKPGKRGYSDLMERVYKAEYTPVSMWDRGRSKVDWFIVLYADAWLKYQDQDGYLEVEIREGLEDFLKGAIMLDFSDWFFLLSFALLLTLVPCLFSFLTAYYTPKVGLGCRSLTFLLYMIAQIILICLWACYLTFKDNYWSTALKVKRLLKQNITEDSEAELKRLIKDLRQHALMDTSKPLYQTSMASGRYRNSSDVESGNRVTGGRRYSFSNLMFWCMCGFCFLVSLLTSTAGSLAQIIGLYRTNFCLLSAWDWVPHSELETKSVIISTNTADAIRQAQDHWIVIALCGIIFLSLVCYIGWWYQRGLRADFRQIAEHLEGTDRDVELIRFTRGHR